MLRTPRLILEAWKLSDWAEFRPIAEDPQAMRYINGGTPWAEEQIREFVDRQVQLYAGRGFCRWRLREAEGGAFIGFCGAGMWRDAADPEIGWWLARRYWGQGIATEAAQCALADLFDRAGVKQVISVAMPQNLASLRVMAKLGLKWQRDFENQGVPLVQYGTSAREFAARRAAL